MTGEIGPQIGLPVVVEYQLTREEAIPFYRWQLARNLKLRRGAVLMALMVVMGAICLASPGIPWLFGALLSGVALLELLVFGWMYVQVPNRTWKRLDPDRGTTRFEFTEEDVHVRTDRTDAVNRWSVYSDTLETKDTYLLRIGDRRSYAVIPKRAFRSPQDEARFRMLVERHTVARLERES